MSIMKNIVSTLLMGIFVLFAPVVFAVSALPPLVADGENIADYPAMPKDLAEAIPHQSYFRSVTFSPNGKILAAASWSNIKLWDQHNKTLIHSFEGHKESINSLIFSPNGNILASASKDKSVKLWDIQHKKLIHSFEGHKGSVLSIAFNPNGNILASASEDKTIKLWNYNNKQLIHSFKGHKNSVNSVVFSPDGNILASGSDDGMIKLWRWDNKNLIHSFKSNNKVKSIIFSPNGKMIASAFNDGTVKLWRLDNKKLVHTFGKPNNKKIVHVSENDREGINIIAFSPNGKILASVSLFGVINFWDWDKKELIHSFEIDEFRINAITFSPDGNRLATSAQTVKLWEWHDKRLIYTFEGHKTSAKSVVFSPNGRTLAVVFSDEIELWDLHNKKLDHILKGNTITFSPDGKILAFLPDSSFNNKKIEFWDLHNNKITYSFKADEEISFITFSPNGKVLALVSNLKTIKLFDWRKKELIRSFKGHKEIITSIAFSPDGKLIASSSLDKTIKLWDKYNKTFIYSFEQDKNPVGSVNFSPDGKTLAFTSVATIKLWDWKNKKLLYSFDGDGPAFNPNRNILASAWGEIKLWDWQNKKLIGSFGKEIYGLSDNSISFSPDGNILAVASLYGTIDLWDWQNKILKHSLTSGTKGNWLWQDKQTGTFWRGDNGTLLLQSNKGYSSLAPAQAAKKDVLSVRTVKQAITLESGVLSELEVVIKNNGDLPVWWIRSMPLNNNNFFIYPVTHQTLESKQSITLRIPIKAYTTTSPTPFKKIVMFELVTATGTRFPVSIPVTVKLPRPTWQLYAALLLLLLLVTMAIFYLRRYKHPLLTQLSVQPTALLQLLPEQLPEAQRRLMQTHRLQKVLADAEVSEQSLQGAIDFMANTQRTEWLAQRLGAELNERDNNLFSIKLNAHFPLNVDHCLLFFPPETMAASDALYFLQSSPDVGQCITLIIGHCSDYQRQLRRKTLDVGNKWVAPEGAALTELLLSMEPNAVLAKIIAEQVPLTQISPYQLGGGTNSESMFFGRSELLAHIMNRDPANYLLVAGRQLGKSTLLKALERRYQDHAQISCFYRVLTDENLAPKLSRALNLPTKSSLETIVEYLEQQTEKDQQHYLFLLDEADRFIRYERDNDYKTLNTLRQLSEAGQCSFILAGFWHLYDYSVLDYQSPLKNFGEVLQLGELEVEACQQLATKPMHNMGINYASPALVDELIQQTGQRANLVSISCNELLKQLGKKQRIIEAGDLHRALNSDPINRAMEGWKNLSGVAADDRIDRIIVYAMIPQQQFSLSALNTTLQQHGFQLTIVQLERSLVRLELAFILQREGKHYSWRVPLFCQYLHAQELEVQLMGEKTNTP